MANGEKTYIHTNTLELPGCTARIWRPELTDEERSFRMKLLYDAAVDLVKNCEKVGIKL
ncbi:MAG: hypothetical protein PUB20_01530 [Clostridia bacterium]|nr:hypothetical protein [Clostridia bacterium]